MQLEQLCENLLAAKRQEDAATMSRINIERAILEIVGCPAEGQKTTDTTGYKIRVDQKITRKIDPMAWALIRDQIPEELRPVKTVTKLETDNKGVLWLRDNQPGYYALLCQAMEEKPAKPGVKVEEV